MKVNGNSVKIWAVRLSIAIVVSMLGVGVINSKPFDEDLNPELKAYLSKFPNSDVHDNAFVALYGLMSEESRDMEAVGRSVVAALKSKYEQSLPVTLSEEELRELSGERLLGHDWRKHFNALSCLPRTFNMCWKAVLNEVQASPLKGEAIQTLVKRYEQLIAMPHHVEFIEMDMHTPLPPYHEMLEIGKLRLAELFIRGHKQEAMNILEKEMTFWRIVLRDSQSVIAKMVAVRGLADRVQFISQLMINSDLPVEENDERVARLIKPLSQQEVDISEAVIHDLRVVYSMQELSSGIDHGAIGEPLIAWTTQEIASYNTYFENFIKPSMALASLDSPSFKRERALFSVGLSKASKTLLPNLYNPGGELIVSELYFDESPYMARVHDLNGMLLLANLKQELMKNSSAPIESIVANSSFKNPYTNEQFIYSEKDKTLSFNCESDFSQCVIEL